MQTMLLADVINIRAVELHHFKGKKNNEVIGIQLNIFF